MAWAAMQMALCLEAMAANPELMKFKAPALIPREQAASAASPSPPKHARIDPAAVSNGGEPPHPLGAPPHAEPPGSAAEHTGDRSRSHSADRKRKPPGGLTPADPADANKQDAPPPGSPPGLSEADAAMGGTSPVDSLAAKIQQATGTEGGGDAVEPVVQN